MLTAKSIKVTLVLNPAEVEALVAPEGRQFRTKILAGGSMLDVPLSGKGVRKAIAVINELGAENVAVIIQGKLRLGGALAVEEAGILAQPRAKKETPAEQPAEQVAAE